MPYTYCPISQKKGNQTVTFGKLTEYNTRNIFLGKSFTKCRGSFHIEYISGTKVESFVHFLLLYANLKAIETY